MAVMKSSTGTLKFDDVFEVFINLSMRPLQASNPQHSQMLPLWNTFVETRRRKLGADWRCILEFEGKISLTSSIAGPTSQVSLVPKPLIAAAVVHVVGGKRQRNFSFLRRGANWRKMPCCKNISRFNSCWYLATQIFSELNQVSPIPAKWVDGSKNGS